MNLESSHSKQTSCFCFSVTMSITKGENIYIHILSHMYVSLSSTRNDSRCGVAAGNTFTEISKCLSNGKKDVDGSPREGTPKRTAAYCIIKQLASRQKCAKRENKQFGHVPPLLLPRGGGLEECVSNLKNSQPSLKGCWI